MSQVLDRLPKTMLLALGAFLVAVLFGVALGTISALRPGTPLDSLVTRLTRSGLLEVMSQGYIDTARAKGLSEWQVIMPHAMRNTLIPLYACSLSPRFIGYGASRGLANALVVAFTASSPFILQERLGLSEQAYSGIYLASAFGIGAISLIAPFVCERLGADTTLLIGFVGAFVGSGIVTGAVFLPEPATPVVVGILLAAWSLGLVIGTSSGLAMEQVREYAGTGSSLVGGTMFGVAALISAIIASYGSTAILPTATVMVVSSAFGIAIAGVLRRNVERNAQ